MNMESLIKVKANPNIPDITPGDTVKVSARITEGGKERIQVFQGVVVRQRRSGAGTNFTVRHVFHGVGVERTFPLYSPLVEKVEVVRHGKVRRAKLYYLRGLSGKAARKKIKRVDIIKKKTPGQVLEEQVEEQPTAQAPEEQVEEQPTAQAPEEQVEEQPTAQAPEEQVEEQPTAQAPEEQEKKEDSTLTES